MPAAAGGELVITGVLERISRARHREVAALLGLQSSGKITTDTVLLVLGTPPYSDDKVRAAEMLGIETCDEAGLLERLKDTDHQHLLW